MYNTPSSDYTNAHDVDNTLHYTHHLRSTSRKCIARYPSTKNTPQTTASPMTSCHNARTLKPKLDKIAEPGTSRSRPYLLSMSDK